MSCFLPSSVMLKSDGFRPLMGLPLLSLTVTSTTTNWVVAPNLTTPLGGAGGGVCADTISSPLKSVAIVARIICILALGRLESKTQCGRHAAHIARTG